MKPTRLIAIIIFFSGAGMIGKYAFDTSTAGDVVGRYPVVTDEVKSFGDRLAMWRRANGLLIGDEAKKKTFGTQAFSFPDNIGEIHLDLVVQRSGSRRKGSNLRDIRIYLLDGKGREVLKEERNGIKGAWRGSARGRDRTSYYSIGRFVPQNSETYQLIIDMNDHVFTSMSTEILVEARSNVVPAAEWLLKAGVPLLFFGAVFLFLTR